MPAPPNPKPGDEWEWKDKDDKEWKILLCSEGWKKCSQPNHRDDEVWCVSNPDCDKNDKPCFCMLFRAKKEKKPGEKPGPWEPHAPNPGKKPYEPDDYYYTCFCVRKELKKKS